MNRRRLALLTALLPLCLTMTTAHSQEKPSYPPVTAPPGDGKNIERAMALMATSTPTKRNTVRILFYGQSITEQKWSKMVTDDLRRRFPHADLVIENRAIGGFASQYLVKDAEAALYSFYPDLVIFHVYGSHIEYENIIRRIRERTTADILIQTDHVTKDTDLIEETDPTKLRPSGPVWNQFMNHAFLPEMIRKYGTGRADVRAGWKAYMTENKLPASALLRDGVHLNDHGCFVMAELVNRALVAPAGGMDLTGGGRVRTVDIGSETKWEKGRLTLPFEGNRVDLIAGGTGGKGARLLIDGKPPSAHPELYTFTRATVYPGTPWPGVMRVQNNAPLQLEDWTIRLNNTSDDLKKFSFEVIGSRTGPDGAGTNMERFVSKSGRIVIEPDDWSLDRSRSFTKKPLPEGFEIKFSVRPLFTDTYAAPEVTDPTREYAVTVAQGLPNGKHTLEIIAADGKPVPIRVVRIYRPPLRERIPTYDESRR
jgi:hypothetical protein